MAQLKDLIVNGASRLIGTAYTSDLQVSAVKAATSATSTVFGPGTNGQILKSNGSSVYWDSSVAPASHLHGNITNGGAVTANAALANNDKLLFSDASDSNIVKATSISFDGVSTQSALAKSGDWVNYLEIAGGTMTGAIALKGLYGTEDVDYGDTLPTTASEGQIFFQIADDIGFALPTGGTTGQALVKASNDDGDVSWATIEALPAGGTTGQVLTKNSNSNGDASWATVDALPSGGAAGQALVKSSAANGDAAWATIDSVSSASYATQAQQDASGNVITTTYLTIAAATTNYAFKAVAEEAAIANNDALLFADNTNSNIITRANIKFDGSTTSNYLSQAGTWQAAPVSSVAGKTGVVSLDGLSIGNKTYNGSTAVTIDVVDLGLSSPMTFKGITNTTLTDEVNTSPINIVSGGTIGSMTPASGDVVLQQSSQLEFIYSGGAWHQLGLATSYSLANHVHGNVLNNGTMSTSATIASGDTFVIVDSSDSSKMTKASITFDGSTTSQALSKAGTWITVNQYSSSAGYAATAGRAVYAASAGYAAYTGQITNGTANKVAYYSNATAIAADSSLTRAYANAYINGVTSTYALYTSGGLGSSSWIKAHSSITVNSSHNSTTAYTTNYQVLNNGISYGYLRHYKGTTTTAGRCDLFLGNARASTTTDNARGYLLCYNNYGGNGYITSDRAALGGTTRDYALTGYFKGTQIWGAVWNDYAEFRITDYTIQPGRCIVERGDDTMVLSTERLQRGCEIVSDTYGFAIGQTNKAQTPTAASGRVLAYLYEDRELAKQYIGAPVCSGPNGTVSIMSEEEEAKYPSRIIGTISAIPDYPIWYAGEDSSEPIEVDGRIWIRIR